MSDPWHYQIRLYLADELAELARRDPNAPALGPLPRVLERHNATMKCQLDAFADYVAQAEVHGVESYPLYEWTKATIEDPVKKAKHLKSFALHIRGQEVYPLEEADALEAALQPLVDGTRITRLSRHDTNPANNPQMQNAFVSPKCSWFQQKALGLLRAQRAAERPPLALPRPEALDCSCEDSGPSGWAGEGRV
jgi:hypothetical protein